MHSDGQSERPPSIKDDPRHQRNEQELQQLAGGGLRVIGGRPARAEEFLECVAVGNDAGWGCTGTLIGPRVVVTAGHCAELSTRVFFGTDVDDFPRRGRVVRVKQGFRHPSYRAGAEENDLTILVLDEEIVNIEPRGFAPTELIDHARNARVVGFGHHDEKGSVGYGIKRLVDVPIVSSSCTGSSNGQPDSERYRCFRNLEIVAGRRDLGKDSCSGDSGGPLYFADANGSWWLAGATSRASSRTGRTCGDGGIYVRVERYREWMLTLDGVHLS